MSQRSALIAAATATATGVRAAAAERRDAVVAARCPGIRRSPLLAPCARRSFSSVRVDAFDAGRAVHRRGADRDLPAHPGARRHADGVPVRRPASPAVTCSPEATTTSYSRWSGMPRTFEPGRFGDFVGPADQLVGLARPWRKPPRRPVAAGDLRAPELATWRMRSRSATEVPPNFIAIFAIGLFRLHACHSRAIHRRHLRHAQRRNVT